MNTTVSLNDGRSMPLLGLGVMQIPDAATPAAIATATNLGYRLIDTAPVYRNEAGVGRGVRECGVPRAELFVTTKLWNLRQGYDEALRACEESLAALGLDYIDLYLIHWPAPAQDLYVESWRALIRLRDEGRVRSIGVSNFMEPHLQRIIGETGVVPAVNQIELHPAWQRRDLQTLHRSLGIVTQAWSPLGRGKVLSDARLLAESARLRCTPAQLVLRWMSSSGIATIPKASSAAHMSENLRSLAVELDQAAIAALETMDDPQGRFGPDPMTFVTLSG